jgi:hypothetical protein
MALKGDPEQARVHDFVIPELGRVTPYGVYDVGENRGWVSVGVDHDTATFAVESIRRWWRTMGVYRQARRLLYRRLGRWQWLTRKALEAGVTEVGR